MQSTCSLCSASFDITDADLAFYEKVSPVFKGKKELIPPPTLCPDCRNQRRMAWRNDRTFYTRTCDLTGKPMISIYPASSPFPVYHQSAWHGDGWDALASGMKVDLERPFFDQLKELRLKVPRMAMDAVNCENSDYCNYCGDDKNCYLDIAGEGNEDCYFNLFTKHSTNCVDCTFVYNSTLCYECLQCYGCYHCGYSTYLENCNDCMFCFDLKGCKNCVLCTNLRGKEFYILNEPHTKEEYEKKIRELNLGSGLSVRAVRDLYEHMRIEKGMYRDVYALNCEACTGNDLKNAKNCTRCFNVSGSEDCKYLQDVLDAKDCQDLNYSLYKPEVAYELISTLELRFSAFCMASHYSHNVYYCDLTNNSHDLFGCIGLKHKQYCILNTQYTQEEYEALVPKIIERMRVDAAWGEFLPTTHSLFGYNETVAQEYYPLTEEEAAQKQFLWREPAVTEPKPPTAVIPDDLGSAAKDITKEIFGCSACGKSFRIIAQEFLYYKNQGIPLPMSCPACRHAARNARRNPRMLFSRTCAKCQKAIQTTYAPERPEKVFCEACYLEAVY